MKRKILTAIKQKLCRHDFEFVERMWFKSSDYDSGDIGDNYFVYRCQKCGMTKAISTWDIGREIENVKPLDVLDYPVEKLVLPKKFRQSGDTVIESRAAAYIVAKYYDKYGILLTAYGNKKDFESRGNFI